MLDAVVAQCPADVHVLPAETFNPASRPLKRVDSSHFRGRAVGCLHVFEDDYAPLLHECAAVVRNWLFSMRQKSFDIYSTWLSTVLGESRSVYRIGEGGGSTWDVVLRSGLTTWTAMGCVFSWRRGLAKSPRPRIGSGSGRARCGVQLRLLQSWRVATHLVANGFKDLILIDLVGVSTKNSRVDKVIMLASLPCIMLCRGPGVGVVELSAAGSVGMLAWCGDPKGLCAPLGPLQL